MHPLFNENENNALLSKKGFRQEDSPISKAMASNLELRNYFTKTTNSISFLTPNSDELVLLTQRPVFF